MNGTSFQKGNTRRLSVPGIMEFASVFCLLLGVGILRNWRPKNALTRVFANV